MPPGPPPPHVLRLRGGAEGFERVLSTFPQLRLIGRARSCESAYSVTEDGELVYSSQSREQSVEGEDGAQVASFAASSYDTKERLETRIQQRSLRTQDGRRAWREERTQQRSGQPTLFVERVQLPFATTAEPAPLLAAAQFERLFSTTASQAALPFARLRQPYGSSPSAPAAPTAARARSLPTGTSRNPHRYRYRYHDQAAPRAPPPAPIPIPIPIPSGRERIPAAAAASASAPGYSGQQRRARLQQRRKSDRERQRARIADNDCDRF